MSALTPHIRVLRAEAAAIGSIVQDVVEGHQCAMPATYETLCALRDAKIAAADQLEAEQAALQPPREGTDKPIIYDPKGKR